MRRICQIAALALALATVFVTLGPISDRPQTGYPQTERFVAYFVLGAAFSVAYPRYRVWSASGIVVGSIVLELGQLLVPGRDAGLPDAISKALGGITGVIAVSGLAYVIRFGRGALRQ